MQSDAAAMPSYLQQTRQFAVPEVHVLCPAATLLAECVDAVAQRQQGAVDVGALLHPLALVLGLHEERPLVGRWSSPSSPRAGASQPGTSLCSGAHYSPMFSLFASKPQERLWSMFSPSSLSASSLPAFMHLSIYHQFLNSFREAITLTKPLLFVRSWARCQGRKENKKQLLSKGSGIHTNCSDLL